MRSVPFVPLASVVLASTLALQAASDWRTVPLESYPADARSQIGAARDAVSARPSDAAAVGQLALVLHAWEQYELAAQAYAEAQRLTPGDVTWWALSGMLATRMGRHDIAARDYGRAAALSPTPLLLLRHADALLENGRPDAARAVYAQAVQIADAEPSARYGLGRIALAAGDLTAARVEFERAIALVPSFGAAHYALAQIKRKLGDPEGAKASMAQHQRCLACWPVPNDPWRASLESVRSDAVFIMRQGVQAAGSQKEDPTAIKLHEAAIARAPSMVQARVNLISLYARTGDLERAASQYEIVVASKTQLAEAHRAYGLALLSASQDSQALMVLDLAAAANPLDAAVHHARGLALERMRRLAEAAEAYRRAVESDPKTRGFRFALARVLVNLGRTDDALRELAPAHLPDDAEGARYMFMSATLVLRTGNVAEGRRLAQQALERARKHGVSDLAATIEDTMRRLP
jgi:tetratricopeptide (TPR) repeat protein